MRYAYLVRYGTMRHVGRFFAESNAYGRGQTVVVRSHRGTELGEVLLPEARPGGPSPAPVAQILRAAGSDDLERARQVEGERPRRLAACEQIFRDGTWPLELIDVEPLLDDRRTVLHYLGPHRLDTGGLHTLFRRVCDLDVILEPVGLDDDAEAAPDSGCGSRGAGGCGSEGGCGSGHADSACEGCAVKSLVSSRRRPVSH